MMKILISNLYSWQNKGDAAIILTMIDHMKSEFPKAEITISSMNPDDIKKFKDYKIEVNFLTIIKKLYHQKQYSFLNRLKYIISCNFLRLKLNIFGFFAKKNIYLYALFPSEIRKKVKAYKEYDFVIAAGGGYFISKGPKNKLERYLNHDEQVLFAYDFFLATFFNKPYMLYNQSIGPFFSDKDASNLLPFFKKAEAISCREELTYRRLEKLGLNNLILSEDAAFNLKSTKNEILEKHTKTSDEISMGFTVRRCLPEPLQKKYENEISLFIQKILSSSKIIKVYFIPNVTYEDVGDNDVHVAKRIYDAIDKSFQQRVIVIDEDLHPSDLKYMIGQMDYFFGTRMHSCIFALAGNIKTIALSYEPKTDGVMKSLKMDNYLIDVKDLNVAKLLDLYNDIANDKTYYERLKTEVERVKKDSLVDLKQIYQKRAIV